MRQTTKHRIDELEQANGAPGRLVVVYENDWTTDERTPDAIAEDERQMDAARATMGPNDTLIIVKYVTDWRAHSGEA